MKPIIIIDMETGGLDPERHALLGVGARKISVVDGQWVPDAKGFEVFLAPGADLEIDAAAMKVNGWPGSDWQAGQWVSEDVAAHWLAGWLVIQGVKGPVGGWVLGGFCCNFDAGFLSAWNKRAGGVIPLPRRGGLDLQFLVKSQMVAASAMGVQVPESVPADVASMWLAMPAEARPHMPGNGAAWAAEGICRMLNAMQVLPVPDSMAVA